MNMASGVEGSKNWPARYKWEKNVKPLPPTLLRQLHGIYAPNTPFNPVVTEEVLPEPKLLLEGLNESVPETRTIIFVNLPTTREERLKRRSAQ